MADDGPTSPADSPAYRPAADDDTPVPVASTISSFVFGPCVALSGDGS